MHSTIRVRCPGCNARISAPFQFLGRRCDCPRCRRPLLIRTTVPQDAHPVLVGDDGAALSGRRQAS